MQDARTQLARAALDLGVADARIMEAWSVIKGEGSPAKEERRFLSNKEARHFLGDISRASLWRMGKAGLPVYRVGGRKLFKADDLEAFVNQESSAQGQQLTAYSL